MNYMLHSAYALVLTGENRSLSHRAGKAKMYANLLHDFFKSTIKEHAISSILSKGEIENYINLYIQSFYDKSHASMQVCTKALYSAERIIIDCVMECNGANSYPDRTVRKYDIRRSWTAFMNYVEVKSIRSEIDTGYFDNSVFICTKFKDKITKMNEVTIDDIYNILIECKSMKEETAFAYAWILFMCAIGGFREFKYSDGLYYLCHNGEEICLTYSALINKGKEKLCEETATEKPKPKSTNVSNIAYDFFLDYYDGFDELYKLSLLREIPDTDFYRVISKFATIEDNAIILKSKVDQKMADELNSAKSARDYNKLVVKYRRKNSKLFDIDTFIAFSVFKLYAFDVFNGNKTFCNCTHPDANSYTENAKSRREGLIQLQGKASHMDITRIKTDNVFFVVDNSSYYVFMVPTIVTNIDYSRHDDKRIAIIVDIPAETLKVINGLLKTWDNRDTADFTELEIDFLHGLWKRKNLFKQVMKLSKLVDELTYKLGLEVCLISKEDYK